MYERQRYVINLSSGILHDVFSSIYSKLNKKYTRQRTLGASKKKMQQILKSLRKITPKRTVIFDLDKTLWNGTIEYTPGITVQELKRAGGIPRTLSILHSLQTRGHSLNIASRSEESDKCRYFIQHLFPGIRFDVVAIYPTGSNKLNHILDIHAAARAVPNEFFLFDDEKHILDNAKKCYPKCTTVHCVNPLGFMF
jgi:predicted enzyme involved in methoxymalonyl-ACP biosynthesis